jgi:PAS domain S-box-containing protein
MVKQREQILPEDWEKTPETVKRLVESQQIVENTLLKSERRYRQIIQAQIDLVLRSLPDTTITFANDALCFALGRSLDEVIGMQWSNFVPPEELDSLYRKIAALTPDHPTFENINQDYRANNQTGWTQWINLGIFSDCGELIEIQSLGRDMLKPLTCCGMQILPCIGQRIRARHGTKFLMQKCTLKR